MKEEIQAAAAGEPRPWPKTPELPGPPEPEALPLDAFPPVLRAQVESVAGSRQVPADLPALLALGAVSATVAGKVVVDVSPEWREPVGIYFAAILPPASRKSPTFKAMTEAIREWEARAVERAGPAVRLAMDMVEIEEKRLEKAKKGAAEGKAKPEEVEAARLALESAMRKVPPDGRLLAGDITPEAMVYRMAAQGGRLALLEPEGGALNLLAGLYSKGTPRLEEVKKAWSAEALLVDRIGRAPLRVKRPALTFGVCLQPGVLDKLQHGDSFRLEGFMGRVLWCEPPHGLGSRLTGRNVPKPVRGAGSAYGDLLTLLLEAKAAGEDDDGTPVPHVLSLASEADEIRDGYEAEIERKIRDGGRLCGIRDWAGKAVGQSLRVAALLHLAARGAARQPLFGEPIGGETMEGAVRIVRALSTHALNVLGGIGLDPKTSLLNYILRRAQGLPPGSTLRDLWTATRGRSEINCMDDLLPLVVELEERGCLRRVEGDREGPGRPPSPRIEIHPNLLRPMTTMTTIAAREATGGDSGHSGHVFYGEGYEATPGVTSPEDRQYLEDERAGMREKELEVEVPGLLEVD